MGCIKTITNLLGDIVDPDEKLHLNITLCSLTISKGLDKSGYQVNIFLISQRKHMLWVLIRSTSLRCF